MKKLNSIVLAFLLIFLSSCYSTEGKKTGLEGKLIPDFTLRLSDSSTYSSSKDIEPEKPVVLFYYSPRCPYCRAQINNIIKNIDNLKDIRFCLVTNYPFAEMKQFDKTYKLKKYENIINGQDIKNHLSDYFEVQGVPFIAVYGKDKKLNEIFEGKTYSSYLKKAAFR